MAWKKIPGVHAKIQFQTAARHPSLIYKARLKTGHVSNTHWLQHAVAEKLSRDLDIPLEELMAELPLVRGQADDRWKGSRVSGEVR